MKNYEVMYYTGCIIAYGISISTISKKTTDGLPSFIHLILKPLLSWFIVGIAIGKIMNILQKKYND